MYVVPIFFKYEFHILLDIWKVFLSMQAKIFDVTTLYAQKHCAEFENYATVFFIDAQQLMRSTKIDAERVVVCFIWIYWTIVIYNTNTHIFSCCTTLESSSKLSREPTVPASTLIDISWLVSIDRWRFLLWSLTQSAQSHVENVSPKQHSTIQICKFLN